MPIYVEKFSKLKTEELLSADLVTTKTLFETCVFSHEIEKLQYTFELFIGCLGLSRALYAVQYILTDKHNLHCALHI